MRRVISFVALGVIATAMAVSAQAAKSTVRIPRPIIKLTLVSPKLVNHRLVLHSSDPVKLKFKVQNTGNVTLKRVVVLLGPRAIYRSSKPAARLIGDSTGGSARWKFRALRVKSKKAFKATVQFDFSNQPYSSFVLLAWGKYKFTSPTDEHLETVPVILKQ